MCDRKPGNRCSGYNSKALEVAKGRHETSTTALADYKEKYAESLAQEGDISSRDAIRQRKLARLEEENENHRLQLAQAEFEYNSCAAGRKELESKREVALLAGNIADVAETTERLKAGEQYSSDLRQNQRTLERIENEEGLEAAEKAGWDMYEQSVADEIAANIGLQRSLDHLNSARNVFVVHEQPKASGSLTSPEEDEEPAVTAPASLEDEEELQSGNINHTGDENDISTAHLNTPSLPDEEPTPNYDYRRFNPDAVDTTPYYVPTPEEEALVEEYMREAESVQAAANAATGTVAADAELAAEQEYARALKEYHKNDRIDTPEEEAAQARKRKRQLQLIIIAGAAVLAFTLAKQAASGKQSALLKHGQSMLMRQAGVGGRQVLSKLMSGNQKQLDEREKRAEQEAEQRASKARERVYQKAEQDKVVAERREAQELERNAEKAYRASLLEQERESERIRRQEEYDYYVMLSKLDLPKEKAEEVSARTRSRAKPKEKVNS
jgi:hypothetical protein